jgi:capsular polysaccharide transport system permease protein
MRDSQSDVITLTTRAFAPDMAQEIAKQVIELSEQLVNALSTRMEEDALDTARSEVLLAENKVRDASAAVTAFRRSSSSLNPAEESSALLGIVSGLETRLVETSALLSEKRAFMREDSPEIVSLKNRQLALSKQMALEKGRLAGGESEREMGGLIETYQPLVLDQELARQQYASALSSLELARIEAQRKKQYLVTFIQPNLPDAAVEPNRMNRILTVVIFSFLAYLLFGLMWSALKDHIGR